MAESFQAVTTSLGEAERVNGNNPWTANDYERHKTRYSSIDESRSNLNTVLISANGMNERELVNKFFESKMLKINAEYKASIDKFNREHEGQTHMVKDRKTGSMVEKPYKKKSVDKRRMYAVGKYAKTGQRAMPYDVLKQAIDRGNARAKPDDSTHLRTGVLQQYIVGWGNKDNWNEKNKTKRVLRDKIYKNDADSAKYKAVFEDKFVKPFIERYQKENPSMHVVQAVVQYDETNPHLHMTVLPVIDSDKNSGLGSTAFSDVLKHDHPQYNQSDIYTDYYRDQHDFLKNQLTTVKFKDHPTYSPKVRKEQGDKVLGLGPKNKRDSSKRIRTSIFNKKQQDNNNKMEWLAEKQKSLEDRENSVLAREEAVSNGESKLKDDRLSMKKSEQEHTERLTSTEKALKQDVLDTIKQLKPSHEVPKSQLKKDEEPARIDSDVGMQQHRQQKLSWLRIIVQRIIKALRDELKAQNKLIEDRQRTLDKKTNELNQREATIKQTETKLTQKVKSQEQKSKSIDERSTKLDKRSADLDLKQSKISEQQSQQNKILKAGIDAVFTTITPEQRQGLVDGTMLWHNKTQFPALIAKMDDVNNAPRPKERFLNKLHNENEKNNKPSHDNGFER